LSRFLVPAAFILALTVRAASTERGQLDASPSLFTVLAAINAAGYDAELNSPNTHALRQTIRQELAARNLASIHELKQFYKAHRQRDDTAELSQYISFALSADGPPDFAFKFRTVDLPPDVAPLQGLSALLSRFYREANLEELWKKAQPAFEQIIARYHEPVSGAVLEANSYLRTPTGTYLGRNFQIYVDLLGAPNQFHTRSYADDYYVVVTPSAEPLIEEVRHAYLHYLLDPLATKYAANLNKKKALGDFAQPAPALEPHYKSDFLLLATESLIKAIEARLARKPVLAGQAFREGFILAPHFAEQLPAYEKQPQAMRLYFPELVDSIDLRREDLRLQKVEFAATPRVRHPRVVPPQAKPEPAGVHKTIEEAEQLYSNHDLEKARQAYLRVLRETAETPLHAHAYYGLARVAVLQKNPELAERLFQKALDSSPEPRIKAWVLVYLGRLSDAAGDREQATRHYQNALAVEGASATAHKAAEQGVQQAYRKEPE
jgi:tetratricopeptide (TPR) repeat protein